MVIKKLPTQTVLQLLEQARQTDWCLPSRKSWWNSD